MHNRNFKKHNVRVPGGNWMQRVDSTVEPRLMHGHL